MIRYLLDTNIVSFAVKRSHPPLDRLLERTPNHQLTISSIVEAELRYGAARLPVEARIHTLLPDFLSRIEVLPWDSNCAIAYAALRGKLETMGRTLSLADTMIAAHALAYDFTLVTNDQAFCHVQSLRQEDWTKGDRSTHP